MLTRRFARLIFISLALLLALTPLNTASAQGSPNRDKFPFVPFTLEGMCPFPVYWEASIDQSYILGVTTPNATFFLVTGILKSRMTNTNTGKFIDVLVAGNMKMTINNDDTQVISLHGPFIGNFNMPGLPPLALIHGSQTMKLAADGTMVDLQTTGQIVDLCAELGD